MPQGCDMMERYEDVLCIHMCYNYDYNYASQCFFVHLITFLADEDIAGKITNLTMQVEDLTSTMISVVMDFKDDIKLLKGHLRQKDGKI